jgi:hypothetical protein
MGVEFNEGQPVNYNYQPKKGGIAPLLIKMGLAKDEAGAQKVMIILTIICFALSIYFFMKV